MNRKYKGAGCGCGASRSLGFPQTGGQENGMTGFSSNGGIFSEKKTESKTTSRKRSRGTSGNSGNSGNSGMGNSGTSSMGTSVKKASRRRRPKIQNNSIMGTSVNMVPQRKRQGATNMNQQPMTGGQTVLNSARKLFNIPPTETPLTAATGPNTSYPVATNVVSNPPPPPTLPTPNVATSLPSTPVANSSVANSSVANSSVPNSSVPNSSLASVANTNTVKAATGFFNSLAKLNPFGSNQGSNVQQEISGGRRTKRNKTKKSKKSKKSKSRR